MIAGRRQKLQHKENETEQAPRGYLFRFVAKEGPFLDDIEGDASMAQGTE
ncbi:hypothetical protein J31TS4_39670 [Paenibacillus sp. J31TS4]|nr:hypothetical protein J31TS4_39670 [Paenibacillus sp. J31TS4]